MMHRLLFLSSRIVPFLVVIAVAASCANLPPLSVGTPPAVGSTAEPITAVTATPRAPVSGASESGSVPAVENARAALAQQLSVNVEDVTVVSSGQVDWPNGCLGVAKPGMMCTDAIVPGYQVILEVNGKQYEVRTDLSGQQVVVVSEGAAAAPQPEAAARVRERAAAELGLELGLVRVVSAEQTDWPDQCLGVPDPAELCAQMVTPGYRVTVEANGQQYVYHTDATGKNIRRERVAGTETPAGPANAQTPAPASQGSDQASAPAVGLRSDVNGSCTDVRIDLNGVSFGACGGELVATEFLTGTHRAEQLAEMQRLYDSFGASTPAGKVTFVGKGPVQATPVEQRMVAEWAGLVARESKSGTRVAQYGMEWRRAGGIAGFCDTITVDTGGHATRTSCKQPAGAANASWMRLTSDELTQFYGWLDQLGTVRAEQKDPATADQMTVSATFAGRAEGQATDADKNAMLQFGGTLLQQWADPTPARYVSTLAEVNIRKGPSEQFDVIEKMAAGQQALVTGVSQDSQWWRVICPDDTIGNCWVSADPTLTQPIATASTTGVQPSGAGQADIDETQVLAEVIRRVYTVDDTFGGNSKLPLVYLLSVDDANGNAIPYSSPARPLPAPVQQGVVAALADLPAQFKWVASAGEVQRNQQNEVEGQGGIITVGQVRPQPDGTVQVTCSIYLGPLASGGQTYVLEQQDGKWKVTGTTGAVWMS